MKPRKDSSAPAISAPPKTPIAPKRRSVIETKKIPNAIENSGLKVTLPRLRVLEMFEKSTRRHLHAEDIYRMFLQENHDVGLATIYRVLTQFEQAGILRRQHFEGHKATYELNDRQNHEHFLCNTCGRVEEFEDPALSDMLAKIAEKHQFNLVDSMVYLSVECRRKNCSNKGSKH